MVDFRYVDKYRHYFRERGVYVRKKSKTMFDVSS